jgi:hypothetical protein
LQFFDAVHFSDWLGRLRDLAASPAVLEPLLLQLACIVASFLAAWAIRAATRSLTDRLVERVTTRYRALRLPAGLRGLAGLCYAWLTLVFARQAIAQLGGEYRLIGIAASLTGLCCATRCWRGQWRRSRGSSPPWTLWAFCPRRRRRSTIWRLRSAPCASPFCS